MIFYFTGTGNSLYAAKTLDNNLISIPQIMNSENLVFEDDKIGIVCPIYGHEMPEMVKEFIRKSELHTDYLYIILTYGNRHASAVELAKKTIEASGKKADYIATLLTADNFLPGFDMAEQMKIDKKVDGQLASIKADIDAGRHSIEKVTLMDRAAREGYMKLVKHQPETVWADFEFTDACIGCGICAKVCPAGCIHVENQKAARTGENCQACYACIQACPKNAIKMKELFGFAEKNPDVRYRNEHIQLSEIVAANNQNAE